MTYSRVNHTFFSGTSTLPFTPLKLATPDHQMLPPLLSSAPPNL